MEAVRQIALALIQVLVDITPPVVEALLTFLVTLLEQLANAVPQMVDAGMRLLLGILEGIATHIQDVVVVALEIVSEFLRGIAEGIPEVVQSAVDVVVAFLTAIGEETPRIIDAGFKMIIDFIDGLADAIRENTPLLIESIFDLADAIIDGLIEGLTAGISKVTEPIKELGESILGKFKNVLGIHSPSKEFMYLGQHIGAGIIKGMENITPKVTKASSKMSESVYEMSKKWIDKQRKYHDLSLEAELSKWKETLKYYKEGQDEYYEILNHIADTENRMRQQSFENSKNWIAKEKELNRLSLFDELEAWERVQARYAEGTEQRKEADREYARVRGEIIEQMKQIDQEYLQGTEEINAKLIEDIQAVTEAYEKAVEDRANAIFRSFGLFDEVSMDEEVRGRDLIKNLQDQVNAIDLWASEIERLAKKGINDGLLEELRNMGPKALPQLQALNKLTKRELSLYSDLWETKMFLARTQAEKELEGMKEDTKIKIEELRKQADKDLDALKETWKTKTEAITKTVVDEYKVMGDDIIESLRALNNRSRTQFDQNNKDMKSVIHDEDWNSLGGYIVEGISSGVDDHSSSLIKAMIQLGRNAKRAMENELGIQSPSKVFEKIGKFTIEGLIEGLKDKKHMNVLSGVMNKIAELIDGDMTLAPTIRPVLDMSGVTTGLNSAFSKEQLLRTRQSMQIANNISRIRRSEIPSTIDRAQHITEINNEFVVHATIREEADIRKLSQELYSLQQQTSRGRGVC
jgi:AcrR family transcriptional regulator